MSIQNSLLTWKELLEIARQHTPARRVKRQGQHPSSAPIPSSLSKLAPGETPPVLLYRDTNSWCPFCERVWFALEEKEIPFETEFIDLRNKPQWYLDLVPTALVPAAKIEGDLVYESKDILLALEGRFGETLLPEAPAEKTVALQWIEECQSSGFVSTSYKFLSEDSSNVEALQKLQTAIESHLDNLEEALGKYPGPYFLSSFSLVDIMYSPHLDRLAANLPVFRGYSLKGNERYPRLNAWFEAISDRPAYQRVRSDSTTNNLLARRLFGLKPASNLLPLESLNSQEIQYRAEAAERLSDNYEAAIGDILKNSGVKALAKEEDISIIKDAIELHLRLLATYLISGNNTLSLGSKEGTEPVVAAIGAITLAYIRNRICAPRDMSAGAATALRTAADKVLASVY